MEEALRAIRYANVRSRTGRIPMPWSGLWSAGERRSGSPTFFMWQVVVLVLDGQQLRLRRQEQAVAGTAFRCVWAVGSLPLTRVNLKRAGIR